MWTIKDWLLLDIATSVTIIFLSYSWNFPKDFFLQGSPHFILYLFQNICLNIPSINYLTIELIKGMIISLFWEKKNSVAKFYRTKNDWLERCRK